MLCTYAKAHVGTQKRRYVLVAMLLRKTNITVSEQLVRGIRSLAAVNITVLISPKPFSLLQLH